MQPGQDDEAIIFTYLLIIIIMFWNTELIYQWYFQQVETLLQGRFSTSPKCFTTQSHSLKSWTRYNPASVSKPMILPLPDRAVQINISGGLSIFSFSAEFLSYKRNALFWLHFSFCKPKMHSYILRVCSRFSLFSPRSFFIASIRTLIQKGIICSCLVSQRILEYCT